MKPKVVFKNVYKEYSIMKSNKDKILELLKPKKNKKSFFAVKDISFEVYPGETIGIIGINGSGKSTLSNLLAEVIEPTAGTIEIDGEPSLIAISVGLNNQLSGLENIHLKCMMHGMSEVEIKAITPKIIEFADIGSFIGQPVKNYSSGMRSRLGFAISVHTDPDIIVVDEALSVGDETFYNKCMDKVNEFKEAGKTIFFVSHSVTQMRRISDRVMWIHYGEVREFDKSGKVLNNYKEYIKWYKSLDKEQQKNYKNEMFDQQMVRKQQDAKVKKSITKADKRNRFWFNLQLSLMALLMMIMSTLIITGTPLGTGITNTIAFMDLERYSKKEVEPREERTESKLIEREGYVIDSDAFIYKELDAEKADSVETFTKVYISEQYDDMYKIEFENIEGYIKSSSIDLIEDKKESDLTVELFLQYTTEQFSSAYLYYLSFLGKSLSHAESKLLYYEIIEQENNKVILDLPELGMHYYSDDREFIDRLEIPLKNEVSDELIQKIKDDGLVTQDGLQGYVEGKDYIYLIDWQQNTLTFIED